MISGGGFSEYMKAAVRAGRLVVQPRMGFSTLDAMSAGLASVKLASAAAPRIGTLTIDAYTRVGQIEQATEALRRGQALNGFPIVSHGPAATRHMLADLRDASFPVQVRHGSAFPQAIFQAAADAGLDAIEGGPVSYNLPYSRAPIAQTVTAWAEACRYWTERGQQDGFAAHLESFGGCMLGQLCAPSLLVALSTLECLFFREHGIRSLSLSLAQGCNSEQDIGALLALDAIAAHYLSDCDRHVVFYTYMGLFPRTVQGAERIVRESARVAVMGGAARLIVKTAAEAHGIPTIQQNIEALHWAREAADLTRPSPSAEALGWSAIIAAEAEQLIDATLQRAPSVGVALIDAFAAALLDVPHCSHPNNANLARAAVDPEGGALVWLDTGSMPLTTRARKTHPRTPRSAEFHAMLDFNRDRYDQPHPPTRS